MQENILAVDLSTEQVLEVNLPEQDNVAQIDVYWQDEVTLDLDLSLMYIVSGQREIQDYVDNKSKPEIDDYIETYAKPIVSEVVEEIAAPVVGDYIENTVKPEIKEFADKEMANYAQVAGEQATIATEKANEASETAKIVDEKVQEFSQTTEASKTEFVNFAQEKTEEFAQTAEQATADSQANVEKARIWAEGEQAEVEPLGGTLSSMGAADLAYALANAPEDTPIDTAKMFAMNIFKGEKGDKGDKGDAGKDGKIGIESFATNCITEIPQDIKLELNNGTLTLAQGCKGYMGDGVVRNTTGTPTLKNTGSAQMYLHITSGGTGLYAGYMTGGTVSERPSSPINYATYYNTSTQKCEYYNGSTWSEVSLPIAIVTRGADGFTSIDQVFNGFGYIGSTVFALPGVKGLIPNGRNADGSLRNKEFIVDSVWLGQTAYNADKATLGVAPSIKTLVYVTDNDVVYDESCNKNKLVSNGDHWGGCFAGVVSVSDMKFTSVKPKLPFQAVDRNDSSWVSAQAMPSGKYIDLTLGATGSTYTAPANGWFILSKKSSASNQLASMISSEGIRTIFHSTGSSQDAYLFTPAQKGSRLQVFYNLGGVTEKFRFYYCEGDK